MAKIGHDEVAHIAELAQIGLTEDETRHMAVELGAILEFVEQLQSVATKDVPETDQVTGLVDVWREDEVKPSAAGRDQLLAHVPMQQDGYIKVRRVL